MNILITGYTGFIGSNLTKALGGHRLLGVDITGNNSVAEHFYWEELDQCTEIDCIIHLAGKAHDTSDKAEEKDYFNINTGLTDRIFDHFLTSKASRFIFFSSVKAVADTVRGEFLTEDAVPDPLTFYGKSKLQAEEHIFSRLSEWLEDKNDSGKTGEELLTASGKAGKTVFILRPCMIHGPGNKGNLNLLYKVVKKGIPWPLGAFENKRSFLSVENLIFVLQKLLNENIDPGIYQVADDDPVSTNQLIGMIAESMNKKNIIWKIPGSLISIIARTGDILKLALNTERLKKLTESYVVSNKKLKKAIGVAEMPVTVTEGIKKTLQSFRNNQK